MRILSYGADTVRTKFQVREPLPIHEEACREELLQEGWKHRVTNEIDEDGRHESHSMSYQDADNPTIRYMLHGGEHVYSEFSVPRLYSDSPVNLDLALRDQIKDSLDTHTGLLSERLGPVEIIKLPRLDVAVDLEAAEARPGVISAMQQIVPGKARKTTRHLYPGQTSMVRTPQLAVRGYDKAAELLAKIPVKDRPDFQHVITACNDQGRTRIEFEIKPRSGLPLGIIEVIPTMLADMLDNGFPSKQVLVGGLDRIRSHVDALDVAPQTRNSLLAFAVRYAQLGEDGMKAAYTRRSFFRHKRRFLDYGLRLDDVTTWGGTIDFEPVITELRAAA